VPRRRAALDHRQRHPPAGDTLVIVPTSLPSTTTGSPTVARVDVDDPKRLRGVGATAVHALDQFLAGIAPLGEVHGHRHHPGDGRDRLARHDLEPHPGPAGGDPGRFVVGRGLGESRAPPSMSAWTRILNRFSRAANASPNPASMSRSNRSSAVRVTLASDSTLPVGSSTSVQRDASISSASRSWATCECRYDWASGPSTITWSRADSSMAAGSGVTLPVCRGTLRTS
jgi:hypothetical protein